MQSGEPQPVPVGMVESIIATTGEDGNVRFQFTLREGEKVRVTAGPFADLVGQLGRLDEKGRVRVLLGLMGGAVWVTLPHVLVAPTRAVA
jgi:transcription antitermination factor NusG